MVRAPIHPFISMMHLLEMELVASTQCTPHSPTLQDGYVMVTWANEHCRCLPAFLPV